jgi:hypothetical protein
LYARRWRLELCRRNLKTTLGREQLRCKSPAMAEKELLAYLLLAGGSVWMRPLRLSRDEAENQKERSVYGFDSMAAVFI